MRKEQVLGILRQIVTMIGAALTSYGLTNFSGVSIETLVGFLLTAIPTIWGIIDKTNRDKDTIMSVLRHGLSITSGIFIYYVPQYSELLGIILPSITQIIAISLSYNANGND